MKRYAWVVVVLAALVGVHSFAVLGADEVEKVVKYTLYVGLNDKDTYQQEIPTERAEALVTEIALRYVEAFTLIGARGVWTDELGVPTYENTLVLEFLYATEEQIDQIMAEVLVALNQNSILVERQEVDCRFFSRANLAAALP